MRRRGKREPEVPQRVQEALKFAERGNARFRDGGPVRAPEAFTQDGLGPAAKALGIHLADGQRRFLQRSASDGRRSMAYRLGQVVGGFVVVCLVITLIALTIAVVMGAIWITKGALT